MGKVVNRHQPCINPECGSSDAMQIYDTGDAFCFSCKKKFSEEQLEGVEPTTTITKTFTMKKKKVFATIEDIEEYRSKGFRDREIPTEINKFFDVRCSYDSNGKMDAHYYPYPNGWKVRVLPKTDFFWIGKSGGLMGKEKFTGGGKRLYITTGEIDMLSIATVLEERYGKIYPVITPGSDTAMKELLLEREWIRSFEEVILAFDEDESGKKALAEAIQIIGIDKVKVTKLPEKDPNDVLTKHSSKDLMECLFNAERYVPGGIVTRDDLWQALEEYHKIQSMPFPECMAGVNKKTKGKRYGEITLLISGTGSGKSTLLREDILHTLETTEDKVGIVALEESPAESARKMAGMAIKRNPAAEEISLEDLKPGFDKVFGDDRVMVLDHQGSMSDQSIIDKLEYMCLSGCKHLYIDHITILVSEGIDDLRGNEAQDKIMNGLLRLVKRYPVWICLVSHLRKVQTGSQSFEQGKLPTMDDIRGSGSVKQISFDIIAFARDMSHENEKIRNQIQMSVLKCRYTGLTGPVNGASYDYETGRLTPMSSMFEEVTE